MRVSVEGGKYTYVNELGKASCVLRYGELWRHVTGDKFTYSMAAEIESLREQVERLKALVVMRCDLDVPPQFSQGLQSHEALEPVTAEHCQWFVAKIEKLTKERDELKTVPMKYRRMQFNAELQDEVTQLQKQLAALAEQNAKMREALTKWRYQNLSYNWCCGNCGNEVESGSTFCPVCGSPVEASNKKGVDSKKVGKLIAIVVAVVAIVIVATVGLKVRLVINLNN